MNLRKFGIVGGIALGLMAAAPSARAQSQQQLASIISAAVRALKQANGGAFERMSPAQQNSAVRMMVSETVGSMFAGGAADTARQAAESALDTLGGNLADATPSRMASVILVNSASAAIDDSGRADPYGSAIENAYEALPAEDQTAGPVDREPTPTFVPGRFGGVVAGAVVVEEYDDDDYDNTDWTAGLLDTIATEITGDTKVNGPASDG